ncbi:MAG: Ig-like domain-containing protein [Chitinophagales bacterium]
MFVFFFFFTFYIKNTQGQATTIFSQNFDAASWNTAAGLSPAWSSVGTGNNRWQLNSYTTGWTSTSGSYTPTGANNTTQSARFHTYDAANGTTGDLITPNLDFSSYANQPKSLIFWMINTGGSDKVDVYLSTDGTTYGSSLGTFTTYSTWTPISVYLGTSASSTVKIKFTATSDYGTTDIGIDQVSVVNAYAYVSTSSWTAPSGVCTATVECWGGGGAGASCRSYSSSYWTMGGGGAGGAYVRGSVSVSPGTSYTVTVGAAAPGTTSTTNGTIVSGNPSWFSTTGTIYAQGGAGAASLDYYLTTGNFYGIGATGSSASSIGTTKYAGGSGANGSSTSTYGGGGGSSAGTGSSGNNASTSSGGTAPTGGAAGGNGPTTTSNVGGNGFFPGGGGGGAFVKSSTQYVGGTGAQGLVYISYTIIQSATPAVTSPICNGATSVSGTSTEADGTTITVFKGGVSQGTTTVASGAWTKTGLTLSTGDVITAQAAASCKSISAVSGSVTVSGCGPTVTNVSSSTVDGTYKAGDVITITVTFSAAVTVTGTPRIQLETGTTDQYATYSSGSGTTTLSFTYTVQAGDVSTDLDYLSTSALGLNGGTIIATSGGAAALLTLPTVGGTSSIAGQKAIVIDGVAPTVSTYSPLDGATGVNVNQNLILTFSENVKVGTAGNIVIYNSGGTVFETIPYNDSRITFSTNTATIDPSGTFVTGSAYYVQISNTAITDNAGNAYAGISNTTTWDFSTVGPTVTNVSSSTGDGTYNIGDVITVTVTFSAAVTVTGSPQILLETGATDRQATYLSGSGTTVLSFTYTVQAGDISADLDYQSTTALTLNGGTINAGGGGAATLTLPATGSGTSIAGQKAIVIDGVAPTVSTYNPTDGSTSVTVNQNLILTFSENVKSGSSGTIVIYNSGGTVFESIPYNDSRITIFGNTVTIDPSGTFGSVSDYYVQISNTAITDMAGNSYAGISNTTTWNFTTVCAAISSLPWTENFDAVTIPAYPSCWYEENGDWVTTNNSNSTNDANARSGSQFLRESWSATNEYMWTPGFSLTGGTSYDFSFYWAGDGYADWAGDIYYNTSASSSGATQLGASFVTTSTTTTTTYTQALRSFTPPSSGTYYFAVKVNEATGNPWYLSFDDFRLELSPPPCATPSAQPTSLSFSGQTSTSINGSFTAVSPSPPSGYLVFRSTSSTAPTPVDGTSYTAGTAYTIGGISYTAVATSGTGPVTFSATSLTANTNYYFYIFSYNNTSCTGGPKYLTTSPLSGNTNTCPVAPTALAVTGGTITSGGATITWTPPAGGAVTMTYTVQYRINGSGSGWTTATTTATSPYALGGLSSSTTYDVQVFASNATCSGSAVSTNALFTTLCAPISTLPWTDGFESLTSSGTSNYPLCWKEENGDWTSGITSSNTYNDPRSGTYYIYDAYTATNEYMWTPGFSLTSGTSYDFSFWFVGDGYTGWTGDVFQNTSQISTGATQLGGSFIASGTTSSTTYAQVTRTFVPSSTGTYYFGIRVNANATPWYIGFDDFRLELSPNPCATPSVQPNTLVLSGETSTSINGSFTPVSPSPPSGYLVFRSTSSTAPTPVDGTSYTAGTAYTIGGISYTAVATSGTGPVTFSATSLTANTNYYFYIFSYNNTSCSGGPKYLTTSPLSENTNTCPAAPTALAVTGGTITSGGATITWTAPSGGAVATTYTVQYRINGSGSGWTTASTSTTSPYALGGLSASTTYDVQVFASNATCSGNAVSTNALFTTTCLAISSLPWTENFDAMGSIGTGIFPACWTATFSAGSQPWATSTGNGYTTPPSSPNYVSLYWSSSSATKYLMTPGFTLTSGTEYEFSFDWAGDAYSGWIGDVLVNTSQSGTGATNLGAFVSDVTTTSLTFANKSFSYTPSSNGTYYFLVRVLNSSVPYYLSFDNFRVKVVTCKAPVNITANTIGTSIATISWDAPSGGTTPASYEIYYSTSSTAPTTGTTPNVSGVTTLSHILTGLASTTTYYVWVRSNCGSGDVSSWQALPTFTTLDKSPVKGIPICFYDFENNTTRTTYENQVEQQINSGSTSLTTTGSTGTSANGAGFSQYSTGGGLVGLADGKAFAMYEGATSSSTDPKASATKYVQFSTSTSGFSGLMLTFDEMPNNIDAPYYGISYSLNGSSWTFVASKGTPGSSNNLPWSYGSWGKAYVNLPSACDNQSTLYIRIYTYYSLSSSSAAHLRIDNLMLLAQKTSPGKVFTTLDEGEIYTSITSGATDFIWVRYNFEVSGAGTVMNLNDMAVDEDFVVSNGATVNFIVGTTPTFLLDLEGGNFVLNSGCTIGISSINGITSAGVDAGNVDNLGGIRSFSTGANYVYLGTNNQNSGSGLPTTVNSLTINKVNSSEKVTLTNSVSATTALNMTKGNIYTGNNFVGVGTGTASLGTLNYTRGTSGYVVGKMRRWFNGTNSGDASSLYPLAQEVSGNLKNRYYKLEYNNAPTTGGYLDVFFLNQKMYFSGLPITGIVTPPTVGTCPAGMTFDVTTTSDQGFWVATPQANTIGVNGTYRLELTGQDLVTITELCQLSLLKRVGSGPWTAPGTQIAPSGTISMPTVARSDLSGFSNFGFGGGDPNPLPVELTQFTVTCEDGNGLLSWATASELNTKEFIIERSSTGNNYEVIGTVAAAGNSNTYRNYSFTDLSVLSGQAYYRLRLVDLNNSFKYSSTVELDCDGKQNEFSVYFSEEQGIVIKSTVINTDYYQFELFDIIGKRLSQEKIKLEKGSALSFIKINDKLADGVYLIRINNSEGKNILTDKLWLH